MKSDLSSLLFQDALKGLTADERRFPQKLNFGWDHLLFKARALRATWNVVNLRVSHCFLLILLLLGPWCAKGAEEGGRAASPWAKSVVTIEVTRKQYDYIQPWSRRVESVQKGGVLIGDNEILTTADYMSDHTLIRLQRGGRGKWWTGKLTWVDYHANLAVITAADKEFWDGLRHVKLADPTPTEGTVQLIRWRNGSLEIRKVELNRLSVKTGKLTFIEHLHLEVDSEVAGTGWAEAIVSGDELIGITSSKEEGSLTVLPSVFIDWSLEARKKAPYRPLGYFAFVWQRGENPAVHDYFKVPGEPRGVPVINFPKTEGDEDQLRRHDIILQIDGFDIDTQGDYKDPQYGNLMLENLATRKKRAGDEVKIKVWRDGKEADVKYRLPKADYNTDLVPLAQFDKEPEYVIIGGLLFQPLAEPYLRSWGNDWSRKAPFRLGYYKHEKKNADKPSLVILSLVLPDPFNVGYQDSRYLVLDKLNGKKVRTLPELIDAKKAADAYHVFEFQAGDAVRRIVLDAGATDAATQRVLQRYGIEKEFEVLR